MSTTVPRGREEEGWGRVCGDALGWAADTRDIGMQETRPGKTDGQRKASRVQERAIIREANGPCVYKKQTTDWVVLSHTSHANGRFALFPIAWPRGAEPSRQWNPGK